MIGVRTEALSRYPVSSQASRRGGVELALDLRQRRRDGRLQQRVGGPAGARTAKVTP